MIRRRIPRHLSYPQALALITAVGAVLRLAFIARQPIGLDEDFTAVVVHQPLDRMIDIVSHDSAPPLFYVASWSSRTRWVWPRSAARAGRWRCG